MYINECSTCEQFNGARSSTLLIRLNFPVSQNGFVGEHSIKIINKLFRLFTICIHMYIIENIIKCIYTINIIRRYIFALAQYVTKSS